MAIRVRAATYEFGVTKFPSLVLVGGRDSNGDVKKMLIKQWEVKGNDKLTRLMTWKPYIFNWRTKLENCNYQMWIVWVRDPNDKDAIWRKHSTLVNMQRIKTHVIVTEERPQHISKPCDVPTKPVVSTVDCSHCRLQSRSTAVAQP